MQITGPIQKSSKEMFNSECQNSVLKKNEYRQNYLRNKSTECKELFEKERRRCKQIIQREKEVYERASTKNSEQDYTLGTVQNFFALIKKHQRFNPTQKKKYYLTSK